jgi:hypothetical protein
MFQHGNARICTQFLQAEKFPVPAYSPYMSPIFGMLWINVCQFPPITSNISDYNQQPNEIFKGDVWHSIRQMVTPDTDFLIHGTFFY